MPSLINLHATDFTGGSAPTSHVINTSVLTELADVVCVTLYLGSPQPTITTPAGWTLINSVTSLVSGKFASFYKVATADGGESVDFVTNVGVFGCSLVSTIRGVNPESPIAQFSHFESSSALTFTVPSVAVSGNTGVMIAAIADDTTLETWTLAPTLTQQAISYAPEKSQMVGYFTVQASPGSSVAYAATKTGSATSGMVQAIYFRQESLFITPPSTGGTLGVAYDSFIVASGGTGPYTYSITSGSLPTSLSLNASTGEITGTPSATGVFTFDAHVVDSLGQSLTRFNCVILISATPYDLTVPNLIEADYVNQRIALNGLRYNFSSARNGSNLYCAGVEYAVDTNDYHICVYKSTDDGLTWAPVDRTNGPLATVGYAYYPQTGGDTLYFAYPAFATGLTYVQTFDIISETWGSPSPAAPTRDVNDLWSLHSMVVLSDGTFVVTALSRRPPFPPGHWEPILIPYSSGAWGSLVVLDSGIVDGGSAATPETAVSDGDIVAVIWAGLYTGPTFKTKAAIYSSGTLGAVKIVDATALSAHSAGIYVATLDEFWFGGGRDVASGNTLVLTKGGPSTDPVWSTENPGGLNPELGPDYLPHLAIQADDDIFLVFNVVIDDSIGELQIQYLEKVNLGSWDGPTVMWDTITMPLTPPTTLPSDTALFAVGFSGGELSFIVALYQTFVIIGGYCGTLYYLGAPIVPTPTLSIACPVDGGAAIVGVPYASGEPVVTGDPTLPLAWSLAGGSLPPGMNLDPDTGEVRGTTYVAGTYSYTLEATDSSSPPLMATVDEPCSIPVGGGSGTLPCDNVTPQPETDVRFKLIKVMATMKPETHLPVRGSVR